MSDHNSGIMTIADFKFDTITAETKSALDVHNSIIAAEQTAATAIMSLCENLKKMRDTGLYKSLGFERFEDYTEQACNIKKRQAYNYIQTYERLGGSFLQSNAQLGITKLQLLTEVCAVDREEFVSENDLDGMSVAEIKKLVEENQQKGEQLSLLENEIAGAESKVDEKDRQISELQEEVEKLRNRPIEVAVQDPSSEDIEKAIAEKTASLKAKFAAEKKTLEAESKKKLQKAKEKALAKAEADKQKAINEARAAATAEIEQKYKEQIESAETEKAEALKKAEEIAARLDKNADADLVTASVYFAEAQKQLNSFKQLAEKIETANNGKGAKLKKLATDYLNNYIASIN